LIFSPLRLFFFIIFFYGCVPPPFPPFGTNVMFQMSCLSLYDFHFFFFELLEMTPGTLFVFSRLPLILSGCGKRDVMMISHFPPPPFFLFILFHSDRFSAGSPAIFFLLQQSGTERFWVHPFSSAPIKLFFETRTLSPQFFFVALEGG